MTSVATIEAAFQSLDWPMSFLQFAIRTSKASRPRRTPGTALPVRKAARVQAVTCLAQLAPSRQAGNTQGVSSHRSQSPCSSGDWEGRGVENEGMERGEGQSTKEGEHALRQWHTQQSNPPTVVLCDTIDYKAVLGSTNCARHARQK